VVAVGKRVLAVCGMSASELSSHSKELLSWPDTLRTLLGMGSLRSDPSAHACLLASANKTRSARMYMHHACIFAQYSEGGREGGREGERVGRREREGEREGGRGEGGRNFQREGGRCVCVCVCVECISEHISICIFRNMYTRCILTFENSNLALPLICPASVHNSSQNVLCIGFQCDFGERKWNEKRAGRSWLSTGEGALLCG